MPGHSSSMTLDVYRHIRLEWEKQAAAQRNASPDRRAMIVGCRPAWLQEEGQEKLSIAEGVAMPEPVTLEMFSDYV